MAGVLTKVEEVPNAPFIVVTTDSATKTFLNSLQANVPSSASSDLGSTPPERALWAVPLANGSDSGSAYVVSQEVLKRVQARRY